MPRVYVSSTFSDLKAHRKAAVDAVLRLGHAVVGDESWASSDQRPVGRSLQALASCDVYLGIIGWRYGEVPSEDNPLGLSITELEYRRAAELGMPRLMFLMSEEAVLPRSALDRDQSAVTAFRDRVREEVVVTHFDRVDALSSQVMTALTRLDAANAPGIVAPVTLAVVYAQRDQRLMQQIIDRSLATLLRSGELSRLDTVVIAGLDPDGHVSASDADVVVLGVSPDLAATGFFDTDPWGVVVAGAASGLTRAILLSLRAGLSLSRLLPVAIAIPVSGRSISEESNREAVFVEIAEAVRSAAREVRGRRSRVAHPELPMRHTHKLVDVFKESGVPSVTFVEPEAFYQLRDALEQAGRGVVIEGPSGVGKTTALQTAITQLDPRMRNDFRVLRARDRTDLPLIADLPAWHRSPVAVDDFHRLDPALRVQLVDYLKLLADTEPVDRKLVIVGIPGTGRRLVEMAYDIATRITVVQLGTASDAKVLEMVDKGEAALNVDLLYKAKIVGEAAGSLNVAQILCRHAVSLAGVRETARTMTPIDTDMQRITAVALRMIGPKFDTAVEAFAALDGPDSRTCIELLGELAQAQDGTLALREVRTRRRDLRVGIDWLLAENLIARDASIGTHLLYDELAATLVVDDPQLTFYLRHLNSERLAATVGKRPQRQRTRVFVSYSHRDADWLERLRQHLAPLERRGVIDLWADTRIAAGDLWRDQIEDVLESAGVAVLLISSAFLASSFIVDNELPPLLAAAESGGCRILSLPVRPSLLADTPELSRYQAMVSPNRPLSTMRVPEMEEVLVEVARTIAEAVRTGQ